MKPSLPSLLAALALLLLATLPVRLHAAGPAGSLTEAQSTQDARVLQRALRELHPALTKYRSQAQIDAAFARFQARARGASDAGQMYLAATELAAYIRCGHTWTNVLNQQGASKAALLDAQGIQGPSEDWSLRIDGDIA